MRQKTINFKAIPQTDEEKENYIIGFTMMTDEVDYEGEVYDPKTVNVDTFAASGSLTIFHSQTSFPIGRPVKVSATDKSVRAWFQFDVGENDDISKTAKTAYNKVLSGSLTKGSVETIPTERTIVDVIEDESDNNRRFYAVYKYLELTNFSLVINPANKSAIALNTNRERCEVNDLRYNKEYSDFVKELECIS